MAPGEIIELEGFGNAASPVANEAYAPVTLSDRLNALRNFAREDISAVLFDAMAQSVLEANGSRESLESRLRPHAIKRLSEFLGGDDVALDVVEIIRNNYPTKAQCLVEDKNAAGKYLSDFNKGAQSSDVPVQEQRWAFIRNMTAQIDALETQPETAPEQEVA